MEWKTHLSPLQTPQKRNLFPWRSWLVVILKRQLAVEVLPRGRNLSPEREPVSDPEESGNKRVPKKKRKFSSKEEPLISGPEEAAASKSSSSKKKKKLRKLFQEN